jgi:adenylosuccinate lyase
MTTVALVGCSIDRWATEFRHLQRTEVLEVEEYFSEGQKGSSAMPHKRNPITVERLCGLARILRGNAMAAMENVALWHERDISHSSVERYIGPDACITLDFALVRLKGMMEKLVLYPDNMLKNLNKLGGLVFSQRMLLALTQNGVSREDAYSLVQRNAMKVWEQGKNFLEECEQDKDILKALSKEQLRELFNMDYHTKHVDTIFKRVFGK